MAYKARGKWSLGGVACVLSCVQLFVTPWTAARQVPLSMEFSGQEYWRGLPFPPGNLPDPGIEPELLASPALAGGFFTTAVWVLPHDLYKPCFAVVL